MVVLGPFLLASPKIHLPDHSFVGWIINKTGDQECLDGGIRIYSVLISSFDTALLFAVVFTDLLILYYLTTIFMISP